MQHGEVHRPGEARGPAQQSQRQDDLARSIEQAERPPGGPEDGGVSSEGGDSQQEGGAVPEALVAIDASKEAWDGHGPRPAGALVAVEGGDGEHEQHVVPFHDGGIAEEVEEGRGEEEVEKPGEVAGDEAGEDRDASEDVGKEDEYVGYVGDEAGEDGAENSEGLAADAGDPEVTEMLLIGFPVLH